MGLIKTAMLAGAGMYAVNKYTKSQQNRVPQQNSNYNPNNSQRYMDNGASQQQSYNPSQDAQQQQQRGITPMEFTDRRSQPADNSQQAQPQYLLANSSDAPVPSYGYDGQGGYYYQADSRNAPPQYQNYGQQRRGFVEQDEVFEPSEYGSARNGSGGGSGAFLNSLMQNAGDLKGGKGKDLMSKFMK